jgi:hypothetical protein
MSDIYAGINLEFRPPERLFPMTAEKLLLSRVKGTWRRDILAMAVEEDRLTEVDPFFTRVSLDNEDRRARGAVHPAFMGGEYLPDFHNDEIEVARLELASVTGDVISVRLRRDRDGYHYRVTDEYDGDCLAKEHRLSTDAPLTLLSFGSFVFKAAQLGDIVSYGDFEDAIDANKFINATSTHYPEFGKFVNKTISSLFPDQGEDSDAEDA